MGPIFSRELVTAPRRWQTYAVRAAFPAGLLLLMATAWLVVSGSQAIRSAGDVARFGSIVFQILAPLQLSIALFFGALYAAGSVSQEKDRRTFSLLLMTQLTNVELVLGKLFASLWRPATMLLAGLPVLLLTTWLGGVSPAQVFRVECVTFASLLAAGTLGLVLAYWREKTFQTLALTALGLVLWLGAGELLSLGALGSSWFGMSATALATAVSPWRALLVAMQEPPVTAAQLGLPFAGEWMFVLFAVGATCVALAVAVVRVRAWNTDWVRGEGSRGEGSREIASVRGPRVVWDNPVLWREVMTWAYGRKVLLVKLAYGLLFAGAAWLIVTSLANQPAATRLTAAVVLAPVFVCSLLLINALCVTAMTTERDAGALDLLLVTDLSGNEIIAGKLLGAVYNTKEMWLLPAALCGYLGYAGVMTWENLAYLVAALLVLNVFAAVLGLHSGLLYDHSRTAVAVSLGTLFFLLVGVATCLAILVAFADPYGSAFLAQLPAFLIFMFGGAIGLYLALGGSRPSSAIAVAAILCPLATFWAIASYFLDYTLGVSLAPALAYGFATAAILIRTLAELNATVRDDA